ncbi:MAG: oligosaccharide repeat unit polymerase [Sphingobacteriales bacterium]|uniref:O-antigen polymerase n=1 Tax=Hydrotalea flava TaxID=714549 RepID=UPI0008295410|nr:O-antigen polymerase [Hydrotalea flava]RTL55841.1 MAG: oligosaccharide repeat unit polymerase [Sphingobacteriales bacterium]
MFQLGGYFIWFSKKNIFSHLNLGFCLVSIIIPSLIVNYSSFFENDILYLYSIINLVGAFFYLIGLFLGNKIRNVAIVDIVIEKNKLYTFISSENTIKQKLYKYSFNIYVLGVVGMVLSYLVMGFMPLFSKDPLAAKFFKNEYQDTYRRVAIIYRTSKIFIELMMPFLIFKVINKFKIIDIFLLVIGFFLIFVSLMRTGIGQSILIAISIYSCSKKDKVSFVLYIIFIFFIFMLGSSLNYIIFNLFSATSTQSTGSNWLQVVADGAPDISDHLSFLQAFTKLNNPYTFGLTFFGGLIPFQFKWNPSLWTLYIMYGRDDDFLSFLSGGLRLPISVWGYVSFSWFGVIFVPFLGGFFTGYLLKVIKLLINKISSYDVFYFLVFIYMNIGIVFTNFYQISIYFLPSFLIYYYYIYKLGKYVNKST